MRRCALSAVVLFAGWVLTGCDDIEGERDADARVLVAVASNFASVMTPLQSEFEATTPYRLSVATGSTGKLYAQIIAGAPYDLLLAADQHRPELLQQQGLVQQRFSYALGQLVLWSAEPNARADCLFDRLSDSAVRRVALANPDLAPYGKAAEETLARLGKLDELDSRLVFGENVGQAHTMVATGNAELGFTALSYVLAEAALAQPNAGGTGEVSSSSGSVAYQLVPATLYDAVVQDAVWLRRSADRPAAAAFAVFLQSDAARQLIRKAGYGLPEPEGFSP